MQAKPAQNLGLAKGDARSVLTLHPFRHLSCQTEVQLCPALIGPACIGDLGLRLARLGFGTATLESRTFEEANVKLGNWMRQRARWLIADGDRQALADLYAEMGGQVVMAGKPYAPIPLTPELACRTEQAMIARLAALGVALSNWGDARERAGYDEGPVPTLGGARDWKSKHSIEERERQAAHCADLPIEQRRGEGVQGKILPDHGKILLAEQKPSEVHDREGDDDAEDGSGWEWSKMG